MEEEEEEDDDDEYNNELGSGEEERKKRIMTHSSSKEGSGSGGGGSTPPTCQADNCNADLSDAKHYHRRHKVCEFHAKAPIVNVAGIQARFRGKPSKPRGLGNTPPKGNQKRKKINSIYIYI